MLFRAQNLGPLRDAEVDLSKDLIVLAGPNNSGKTYLAWSVYGLHRFAPTYKPDLSRWARQLIESPDHTIDLADLSADVGPSLLQGIAAEYGSKLHLCFATESMAFADAKVLLSGDMVSGGPRPISTGGLARHEGVPVWVTLEQPGAGASRVTLQIDDVKEGTMLAKLVPLHPAHDKGIEEQVEVDLYYFVLARLRGTCTLFPAERIAVNTFAKELFIKRAALVDEMVDADLEDQGKVTMDLVRRRAGRYAWPIRDSLRVANDLANLGREKGPFAPLAEEIEAAVLGGKLSVTDTGEMLFSPHDAADRRLQMQVTASVVKSLASLVFYFRHLASPGDFIIIDEPELNLHPDNQRKITRLLAKAVKLGVKVMMSTHSDYVLRELNHLIMLSKLPEGEARALGYDPQSALARERLGVYLFDEHHAEPVPVEETGFSIKTIDAVVNQLNADEQRLYARLSG
jgi:energy-coupling factor transporter ATP-binding protein EcfA2